MFCFAVIAGGKAAAVFEFIEGALNPVALLVEYRVIGAGCQASGPGRDHRRSPLAFNELKELLTIIGFVGNDVAGVEAREERNGLRTIVALSGGDNKAYGSPLTIHG